MLYTNYGLISSHFQKNKICQIMQKSLKILFSCVFSIHKNSSYEIRLFYSKNVKNVISTATMVE